MQTLDKLVTGIALTSAMFFITSCTGIRGGERIYSKDYTIYSPIICEIPVVENIKAKPGSPNEILENLARLDETINAGIVSEKYKSSINLIMEDIKAKRYNGVQYRIKKLAEELEKNKDKYSRELLGKVKNFTYIKYEYVSAKYKFSRETNQAYYKKLIINPYNGKRRSAGIYHPK